MASWIKVQTTLPESPKIFRLARLLNVGRMEALGYAVRWFCWLDAYCANGATELRPDDVDALVGMCGITRAFCALGWTSVDADGYVRVQEFDKHNGESSKKRAETQGRVALHRGRLRAGGPCNADDVTLALPEGEGDINNMGAGMATADMGAEGGQPAPSPDVRDDVFRGWLAALCGAHPSACKSLYLAADVLKAAKAAFVRCPQAAQQAELLAAYFRDPRLADNHFYAPRGQRKFFEDLEDVLAHAERWRRWSGWKPGKRRRKARQEAEAVLSPEESERQRKEALAEMQKLKEDAYGG